jgi:polar amino acid transport system substrate-binding protein
MLQGRELSLLAFHGISYRARLALALAALALVVALPMGHSPGNAKEWTTLRIASEGARPPFNYIEGDNELRGFEIDLGKELCARMKVACVFVQQDFDHLISGLEGNHYDAIMAAMEITDERRERLEFSEPYVRMPSAFAAARHRQIHGASPTALKGRTIGVEEKTTQQAWLAENYEDSTIKQFYSLEEAMLELANGRIDCLFADKLALDEFLRQRKEAQCCKLLADVPRDPVYFGEGIGVGMRKEDADLKALFDKAIEDTVADGTYAKIRAKYFDFEIY